MKKLLLLAILLTSTFSFAQVATMDIFFLKDGMEKQYLELEEVWSEFHSQMIEDGKMYGWSLFKIESVSNPGPDVPQYMTLNRYESIEALKKAYDGMTPDKFNKIVRKRLRGKLTSKQIRKILETNPKKMHHSYTIELTDQTMPSVEMNVGEVISVDAMVQKNPDYEKYESNWAKPIMQDNVDQKLLKWWGFTKVIDKNKQAANEITHFTWQMPVEGKKRQFNSKKYQAMFGGEFTFNKLVDLVTNSRDMLGSAKLKLIKVAK